MIRNWALIGYTMLLQIMILEPMNADTQHTMMVLLINVSRTLQSTCGVGVSSI